MDKQNNTAYTYYAFISYKREDERWAKWLQRKLESYRLPSLVRSEHPSLPRYIRPIFRDSTDLVGGILAERLHEELEKSRYLIVICSPATKKSEWVDKEAATFIEQGRSADIIPFVVDGEPHAADSDKECFPSSLRNLPPDREILGISVKELGREKAFVRLVATMLGVSFDTLWQRHRREQKVRRAIAASFAALLLLAGLFVWDYNRSTYEYFADYVDCDGMPEGVVRMTKEQAETRGGIYRFRYERTPFGEPGAYGWRLADVAFVNGSMRPLDTDNSEWNDRYPIQKIDYSKESGRPVRISFCDRYGKVELRHNLSDRNGVRAAVADIVKSQEQLGTGFAGGTLSGISEDFRGKSLIVRYVYTRDKDGHITGMTFHANNDPRIERSATTDADGIFGYRFDLDSLGRRTAVRYVGADGKPVSNKKGVASRHYYYDSFGNISEIQCRDLDGKLTLNEELWATKRCIVDDKGRYVEIRFFDIEDRPTTDKTNAISGQIRKLDKHGETTEAYVIDIHGDTCNYRSGYAMHRFKYDRHGNRIEASVYNADGTPTTTEEGVHKYLRKYDSDDRIIEYSCFGTDDFPVMDIDGVSRYVYGYDSRGNKILTEYYGVDGQPILGKEGAWKETVDYNDSDLPVFFSYFDTEGNPTTTNQGFSSYAVIYDDLGNIIEKSCYDADGRHTTDISGRATMRMEYDNGGNAVAFRTYGVDGAPEHDKDGVYGILLEYDSHGRRIKEIYVDSVGAPTVAGDGTAGALYQYDSAGNTTEMINIDTQGRPTFDRDGVAIQRRRYDSRNNHIETTCFDTEGRPIVDANGSHRVTYAYDIRGNRVGKISYDLDGRAVQLPDGDFIVKYEYDNRDNLVRIENQDGNGNFVGGKTPPIAEMDYDIRGNRVELRYFDGEGKPATYAEGISVFKYEFDGHNRMIRQVLYDIDGEPIPAFGGVYYSTFEYDSRGNESSCRFWGKDGEAVMNEAQGASVVKSEYDSMGNRTLLSFFDENEEPCISSYGYSSQEIAYDRFGNIVSIAFYDAEGKPLVNEREGVASFQKDYDKYGNVIEVREYDAEGNFMLNASGWAIQRLAYDIFGNIMEVSHYGVDGKPIDQNGYSREVRSYDRYGYRISTVYYNAEGKELGSFVEMPYVVNVTNVTLTKKIPVNSCIIRINDWKIGDSTNSLEDLCRRDRFRPKTVVLMTPQGEIRTVSVERGQMGISWIYQLIEKSKAEEMRKRL